MLRTWFMINMFITNGMYLSFYFFMSCPEPPMDISGEGSFPVQSGDYLINYPTLLGVGI